MFNLLKADLFRITKGQLYFYPCISIIVLALFLSLIGQNASAAELVQNGLAMGTLLIPLFLTHLFVIVWGHEFSYRVVNNSLISGTKRWRYFVAKVLLTFLLTLIIVLLYFLALLITSFCLKGSFNIWPLLKILLCQLPLYLAISSLGIFLFNAVKKNYIAVALFISIAFIGEQLIGTLITTYFSAADFLLETFVFANLQTLSELASVSGNQLVTMFVSSLIYTFSALIISFILFNQREFK